MRTVYAMKTTDLCDNFPEKISVAEPIGLRHYGGLTSFYGTIATVKCHEDNSMVRRQLETPGMGRILVVDGGGSLRCALLGDMLAQLATDNGWRGVIVYGLIRDTAAIRYLPLGVMALGSIPLKSEKRNSGTTDVPVRFAGVTFVPGQWLYADEDGVIVSNEMLI
ncbi:MAG: ribonuclease E activity regulator RraA [Chitinophagales bacterium]|nr:ribonuclease E activity regulator RraA [Chitinophagales bacterium]